MNHGRRKWRLEAERTTKINLTQYTYIPYTHVCTNTTSKILHKAPVSQAQRMVRKSEETGPGTERSMMGKTHRDVSHLVSCALRAVVNSRSVLSRVRAFVVIVFVFP